jgi:hypothetical protein
METIYGQIIVRLMNMMQLVEREPKYSEETYPVQICLP